MEASDLYYKEIRHAQLLTAPLEQDLLRAYRTCANCQYIYVEPATVKLCPACDTPRNLEARARLVSGAVRYVAKVARDYLKHARGERHGEDLLLALVSAGNLGLLVAVDRFDVSRGTRFLTYAAWWIREKILEELDAMGSVRIPAYYQKALRSKWRDGTSKETEFPGAVIEDAAALEDKPDGVDLLDAPISADAQHYVRTVLSELRIPARERYAVCLLAGVREEPKTLRQVATRIGVSPEAVRDIRSRVYKRMHDAMARQDVDSVADVF